jgi:hypothetical protein
METSKQATTPIAKNNLMPFVLALKKKHLIN